jgi:hypothetical protein
MVLIAGKRGNLRPVPDLSHMWQRFLLASSLVVGLLIGVTATVFGYSNLTTVNVHWSVFHIDGVPLWTVAVVPLALVLVAGTLYHWLDGLHHFTEHMRHRRRVHELEAEIAGLRSHLDQVLEMPDHSTSRPPARSAAAAEPPAEGIPALATTEIAALPEPAATDAAPANGAAKVTHHKSRKRAAVPDHTEPAAAVEPAQSDAEPPAAKDGAEKPLPAEATTAPATKE